MKKILEEDGNGNANTIIMGDWNSVVGDESYRNVVGPHGLGRKNHRGQMLIMFCERNGLIVINTWFKKPKGVQDILEEKLGAIGCDNGNVEMQWNNIKECVLDSISDLVGKVEKRERKPCVTQEMISKMDERMKWKNVNNEEDRKNYRKRRK
jgi:hypothetical protein